jgi:hypothetical protein
MATGLGASPQLDNARMNGTVNAVDRGRSTSLNTLAEALTLQQHLHVRRPEGMTLNSSLYTPLQAHSHAPLADLHTTLQSYIWPPPN